MATNKIGTVALMLTANAKGVQTGVNQAIGSITNLFSGIGKFASRTGSIFTGILAARGFAAAVEGAKDLAHWAAQTAMEYEQAEIAFQVLTGSKSRGTGLLNEIQKLAVETPFKSSELIAQAKLLKAYGVETGDVIKVLGQLGDVASGTGVDINRVALAYGQVISKGRFQASELRQFTEAGVGLEHFAKAAGVSGQQLLAMMEAGQVSSRVVRDAFDQMTSSGGMFFGMMDKQSRTTKGRFDAFIESLEIVVQKLGLAVFKEFGVTKFFDNLAKAVQAIDTNKIADWLSRASEAARPFYALLVGITTQLSGISNSFGKNTMTMEEFGSLGESFSRSMMSMMKDLTRVFLELGLAIAEVVGKIGELLGITSGHTPSAMMEIEKTSRAINDLAKERDKLGVTSYRKNKDGSELFAGSRVLSEAEKQAYRDNLSKTGELQAKLEKLKNGSIFSEVKERFSAMLSDLDDIEKKAGNAFEDALRPAISGDSSSPLGRTAFFQRELSEYEKFQKTFQDALMPGGATADKAMVDWFEGRKKLLGNMEIRNTAPLLETGSQAAASALNQARAQADSPMYKSVEEIRRILEQAREAEKQTAANTKKMADNIRKSVDTGPIIKAIAIGFGGG